MYIIKLIIEAVIRCLQPKPKILESTYYLMIRNLKYRSTCEELLFEVYQDNGEKLLDELERLEYYDIAEICEVKTLHDARIKEFLIEHWISENGKEKDIEVYIHLEEKEV